MSIACLINISFGLPIQENKEIAEKYGFHPRDVESKSFARIEHPCCVEMNNPAPIKNCVKSPDLDFLL